MATRRIKSVKVLKYSEGFTAGLSSAILEWFLIFLLFANALFSYLVTKFARTCKLKIPCILCSRLDHVFGSEKPGFYRDLICSAHKLEFSPLVFCHIHDKLADVHGMCEGCLYSFATEKKSNSETYRLLVGKFGIDHELFVDKDPLLKHSMLYSSSERNCSCCNEPWKPRQYSHRPLPKKSIGSEDTKFGIQLPDSVGHSGSNLFDGLKKSRAHMAGRGFDPLAHIGYSELKISSDSESEVLLSDDDDAGALMRETNNFKEGSVARSVQSETQKNVSDTRLSTSDEVSAPKKLIDQASTPVSSLLVSHEQHDVVEHNHMTSPDSPNAVGHGLEELNWKQFEPKSYSPAPTDLISLDDLPSPSNVAEAVVKISRESFDMNESGGLVGISKNAMEGKCESEIGWIQAAGGSGKDQVVETGDTFDTLLTDDVGKTSSTESGEASKSDNLATTITGSGLKRDQISNNLGLSLFNLMDLGDAYKQAAGNKGGQASSMLTEQHMVKDSAKVNEDLKLLLTQISTARGSDPSANDMSPTVRGLREEMKIPDGFSSTGLDTLKRISIERNESGFESLDGSVVSEIEGESLVDRMKRQVEYDRKCMSALYKELDEERNASAVAANQAMAMITRLQEEKAALHMEALQYLRMMEEQAEYDVEALQKANDLLAEREKEIQDLEADLDYYRIKYPEEEMEENIPESCNGKEMSLSNEHSDLSIIINNTNGASDLQSIKKSEDSIKHEKPDAVPRDINTSIITDSLLKFEDERLYISQCLKTLEKKLSLGPDNGVHMDMCNGLCPEEGENEFYDMEQDQCNGVIQGRNQMDYDGSSYQSKGSSPAQESSSPSAGDPRSESQENHHGREASLNGTTDLVSIESEVLDLNDRLETLEADRDFLEHALNSLQNGDEGLKFIQEIADHLRELRRIGIRRREKDVA